MLYNFLVTVEGEPQDLVESFRRNVMELTCQSYVDMLTLGDLNAELEEAWQSLVKAQRELELREKMIEQRELQFDLKWDLLIKETEKLTKDKKEFEAERRKLFFEKCASFDDNDNIIHGEMFFSGVSDAKSLKKRYKDLIKIYHPDSESGDNATVLEINREYDELKQSMN